MEAVALVRTACLCASEFFPTMKLLYSNFMCMHFNQVMYIYTAQNQHLSKMTIDHNNACIHFCGLMATACVENKICMIASYRLSEKYSLLHKL